MWSWHLRETSREAFQQQPNKFNTLQEALTDIQTRLRQPISNFIKKSWLLENYEKQTKLTQFKIL